MVVPRESMIRGCACSRGRVQRLGSALRDHPPGEERRIETGSSPEDGSRSLPSDSDRKEVNQRTSTKPGRVEKATETILDDLETKLLAYVDGRRRELRIDEALERGIDREGHTPQPSGARTGEDNLRVTSLLRRSS